jgi:hypothetical protein
MKKQTVGEQINAMVKEIETVPGYKTVRNYTERRQGTKGYGYYTIIDVAYEGMRTAFFKTLAECQEWYIDAKHSEPR